MKKIFLFFLLIGIVLFLFYVFFNKNSQQEYFESGALKSEYSLDEEGRLNGRYTSYSESGQKIADLKYSSGELEGIQRYFYLSGQLRESFVVNGGFREDYKKYNENGILVAEGQYDQESNRLGSWKYYNENGLTAKGEYNSNGLKIGVWEYFDNEELTGKIDWEIYSQDKENFMLNLPSSWEVEENQRGLLLLSYFPISTGTDRRAISLSIVKLEEETMLSSVEGDLKEVYLSNFNELKKELEGSHFDVKEMRKVTINGNQGVKCLFTVSHDDGMRGFYQFLIKRESGVYLLNFVCFKKDLNDYLRIYNEIAYSFR